MLGTTMRIFKNLLPYILISLVTIGLWRQLTLPDNYAWSPKGKELLMLDIHLTAILVYKTVFGLVLANLAVYIVVSTFKNRSKPAIIAAIIGIAFYLAAGQAVNKYCAFHYYVVFMNQSVSEEFLLRPIKEAGYHIGPILTREIKDKNMKLRRYAIAGLADIRYKPATETLHKILLDKTEPEYARAEAYVVLTKFNTESASEILSHFKSSAKDTADKKVIELGNYFLHSGKE